MNKRALIFGAGKIGRGFVGHLLYRSGYTMTFVDPAKPLIEQLNTTGSYPVTVHSTPPQTDEITGFRAIWTDDRAAVLEAIRQHDLFFTAVGGANLPGVGKLLAEGLTARGDANVILCENWKDPAADLREAIDQHARDDAFRSWTDAHLGLVESQVLRPSFDPDPETRAKTPLAIYTQDWWTLPCDGDAFRGPDPKIEGVELRPHFRHELIRKVYSYNCMSAVIAYLGWLRGYTFLHEAALDNEIRTVAEAAFRESSAGQIAEYGFATRDQEIMMQLALQKYQDTRSPDPIERHARDSRRKLSPEDRLMGPANLALKHGAVPSALAMAIAAALHYDGSDDPGTQHVQKVLRGAGLEAAIEECCGVANDSPMHQLIVAGVPRLQRFNRRGVALRA